MLIETVGCRYGANELWLGDVVNPATVVTVERVRAHAKSLTGTYNPKWNANTF